MTAQTTTRRIADVQPGEALPRLEVPLDLLTIMATAIATRDYQPVHHDVERARSLGNETVFMSTHSTAGLLERFVMQWAGPGAFLRSVTFRLGTPNYAGDRMTISGSVQSVNRATRIAVIAVAGTNSRGTHVDGTVAVRLG
jgi:acyl dehydratase